MYLTQYEYRGTHSIQKHGGKYTRSTVLTPPAFCFFLCDNKVQSFKTFTGSGCHIDYGGRHSAFRAHRIHIKKKKNNLADLAQS